MSLRILRYRSTSKFQISYNPAFCAIKFLSVGSFDAGREHVKVDYDYPAEGSALLRISNVDSHELLLDR